MNDTIHCGQKIQQTANKIKQRYNIIHNKKVWMSWLYNMYLRQICVIFSFCDLNKQVFTCLHRAMLTSAGADLHFPHRPISSMSFLCHITVSLVPKKFFIHILCFIELLFNQRRSQSSD